MKVLLIDIGTSRGIRIPAAILKEFDRPDAFDLKIENNRIVLDILQNPRDGWDDKFKNSSEDLLIEDDLDLEKWDEL